MARRHITRDIYVVLTRGWLDERKWEPLETKGAASDLALDGRLVAKADRLEQGAARDARRRRQARGDELDEHDLEALWQRAEGPYARLAPPARVVPLAERLAAERPDPARRGRTPRRRAASSPPTSPLELGKTRRLTARPRARTDTRGANTP